jgi:predicted nucleotidyltransferase
VLWANGNQSIRQLLKKSFRRLYRLGILSEEQLTDYGIVLPDLSGALSRNLELITGEIDEIRKAASQIEADPELSSLIYPVFLVYGSKLKGYGDQEGDVDLAVFIKPGTAVEEKERLRQLLKDVGSIDDGVTEFWLEEHGDQLKVHDFEDYDAKTAESYWSHVLFGAAWVGNPEVIDELQQKIFPAYFYETDEIIHGHEARRLWLEEMERDILQYRLMHRGYEQHYPRVNGLADQYPESMDGHSMFWDSGYRQLATKLFIDKVFLPKLRKTK